MFNNSPIITYYCKYQYILKYTVNLRYLSKAIYFFQLMNVNVTVMIATYIPWTKVDPVDMSAGFHVSHMDKLSEKRYLSLFGMQHNIW